jgi:hypothetical protein
MQPKQILAFAVLAVVAHYAAGFTFTTGAAAGTVGTTAAVGLGGASIGTGLALVGGIVLLKAVALAGIAIASSNRGGSRSSRGFGGLFRGKRSALDKTAYEFAAIAQLEPEQCYRRLICDLATGQMPKTDNDVILSLFNQEDSLDISSPIFEFSVAAELGKHTRDIKSCEVRYSCPVSGAQLLEATV